MLDEPTMSSEGPPLHGNTTLSCDGRVETHAMILTRGIDNNKIALYSWSEKFSTQQTHATICPSGY